MKQTAVEWFFEQLTEVNRNLINKTYLQNNNSLAGYELRKLFEQAKKMEKEQIIDAYNIGFNTTFEINFNTGKSITAEQYYSEKFKKK